jgi:hypothetical protein
MIAKLGKCPSSRRDAHDNEVNMEERKALKYIKIHS